MKKKKPIRKRNLSEDKAQAQKDRAVEFLRRVKSDDAADKLDDESLESWAARKGIRIDENPRRRKKTVSRKKPRSKVGAKKKVNPKRRKKVVARNSMRGAKRSRAKKAQTPMPQRKAPRARSRKRNFGLERFLGRKPRVTSQTWDRAGEKRRAHALKKAGVSSKQLPAYTDYSWREMQSSFSPGFIGKVMSGLKANPKKKKRRNQHLTWEPILHPTIALNKRRNTKRKRNQGGAYDRTGQTYAMFHGRGPGKDVEIIEMTGDPKHLAGLGTMVSLVIGANDYQINWGKGEQPPLLATDAGANQLYIVGGDQNIAPLLHSLGVEGTQDLVDLGEVTMAEYYTQKKFDNFKPIVYYHHFGEEDAKRNPRSKPRRPRLIYSRRNRKLMLVGGAYKIRKEGITN